MSLEAKKLRLQPPCPPGGARMEVNAADQSRMTARLCANHSRSNKCQNVITKKTEISTTSRQDSCHHRLRKPGPRARAESARFRRDVVVGSTAGSKSLGKAEAAGLKVMSVADAAKAADVVMILVPDHIQADLYQQRHRAPHDAGQDADVRPRLQHPLRQIEPPADVDVSMIAPKAPGPSRPRTVYRRVGRARAGRRSIRMQRARR